MSHFYSLPDKEKNYQGYMVHVLGIVWPLIIATIVSVGFVFFPHLWQRWLTFLSLSLIVFVITFLLNLRGYTRLAANFLTLFIWTLITIPCYTAGGISAPGILTQSSVILTAGFLLGWRGGLAIGILTMGTDFGLAYLEMNGLLPVPSVTHTPLTRWIEAFIPFGTILVLQYFATNHLRAGLIALQNEIIKREKAEINTSQLMQELQERVKELKTLYHVSTILRDEEIAFKTRLQKIVELLPTGWQFPEMAAAKISFAGTDYSTENYRPSEFCQRAEVITETGVLLSVEIVYLKETPRFDEGPFLHEERHLINMIVDLIKVSIERREREAELKDYKYALDTGYMVSISGADRRFTYVNDNFCKTSQYNATELLGHDYSLVTSDLHTPEYFDELNLALRDGKPYMGEFCNKAKDGTLYWVDTTIVPFSDAVGKIYQYLSINHDITERKVADIKIKQSEQLLKKITSQVPGNSYMFELDENGNFKILFMSKGKDIYGHYYVVEEILKSPEILTEVIHPDDKNKFNAAMKDAYKTQLPLSIQYRTLIEGTIRWRWLQAIAEQDSDGKILWYGGASDITQLVDYLVSIEQIIFDIGHVIRKPVSTMLSLTTLISEGSLSEEESKIISQQLHQTSEEMDKFIRELNDTYAKKRQVNGHQFDITCLIDKRGALFQ